MPSIKMERYFEAPIETVFARITDFANMPNVVSAVMNVEMLTEGPVGVGTRFRETREMFGREASEEMEVTHFEPPHRCVLDAESHGSKYRTEFVYTESGHGTDLVMTFNAQPITLFAKVMSVLMKPMMKKVMSECGRDLDEHKAAIEAG